MVNREEKIEQIVQFVKDHPESLASRTVLRRFVGMDYEVNEEFYHGLEDILQVSELNQAEIDSCYDLIK